MDEVASQRDMFRVSNDTPASSSDLHSTNHDAANHLPSRSPSSANGIPSDASTVPSNGLATSNTGAFFNGQQVDPTDLRIFESFQHGRSLNDDQAFLVIYLIDTFRYELTESSTGSIGETLDVHIRKAIFRAYMDLIKNLPEKISTRIHIQIIPFESIVQQQMEADVDLRSSHFKRLAFHVYEQLRRTVSHTVRAKSLTDFGPAASEAKSPAKLVGAIAFTLDLSHSSRSGHAALHACLHPLAEIRLSIQIVRGRQRTEQHERKYPLLLVLPVGRSTVPAGIVLGRSWRTPGNVLDSDRGA